MYRLHEEEFDGGRVVQLLAKVEEVEHLVHMLRHYVVVIVFRWHVKDYLIRFRRVDHAFYFVRLHLPTVRLVREGYSFR